MRQPLLVAYLVGAAIGVVVLRLSRGSAPQAPHPRSGHATAVLGVEALIAYVEGLTGPVRVKGIGGQVLPDQHLFFTGRPEQPRGTPRHRAAPVCHAPGALVGADAGTA